MDLQSIRKPKGRNQEALDQQLQNACLEVPDQKVTGPKQDLNFEITLEQTLEVVMNGVDVLSLIADRDHSELSDRDIETIQVGLQPDILGPAFDEARKIEVRSKSREMLRKTGTLGQYERAVNRLRKDSIHGDPFHQFSILTKQDAWSSTQSKYLSKAGLNREASDHLISLVPALLNHVIDRKAKLQKELKEARRAYYSFGNKHYSDLYHIMADRMIGGPQLLDLARSAIYFADYRPDIHALRSSQKFADARRSGTLPSPKISRARRSKYQIDNEITPDTGADVGFDALMRSGEKDVSRKSKKKVLQKLNQLERQKRKTDPDFDWRSVFWDGVERDQLLNTEKKAALAVLVTTGCRPVALVGKGVDVHLMKPMVADDKFRIVLRIPDTKGSDIGYLGKAISPMLRATNLDKEEVERLRENSQVVDFNTKGQHYIYFELECRAPESIWLAQHLQGEGLYRREWSRAFEDDEQKAFARYDREILKSLTVTWPHRFADPEDVDRKSTSEQLKLKRHGIDKTVKRISKRTLGGVAGVSPYVFRHAISSDTKAIEDDPDLRSAALGHASGRTSKRYGTSSQGRRDYRNRASQITGRQQHRQVRNTIKPGMRPGGPGLKK